MGMTNWHRSPAGTFAGWSFEPETFRLDLQAATLADLEHALCDCYGCIATEYPETQGGTYRALPRAREIEEAMSMRYGAPGDEAIIRCRQAGMHQAGIAHPR